MDYRKQILDAISGIQFALRDYERDTLAAVSDFRETRKRDLSIYSQEYKDKFLATTQKNLKTETNTLRERFQASVSEEAQTLRDIYTKASTDQPSGSALASLRIFRDFDIPMTEDDVKNLAAAFNGNPLGLRALAAVASASGWTVSLPVWDALPAALNAIETAAQTPERKAFSAVPEYVALLDGDHKAVRIYTAAAMLDQAVKGLTDIAEALDRQGVSIYAKETEAATGQETERQRRNAASDAAIVSATESDAERIARQIGIEKSTDDAVAKVGADHYTLKG